MGRSGCVPPATSAILTHTPSARRVAISVAALRPASSPSSVMATWRTCEEWSAAQAENGWKLVRNYPKKVLSWIGRDKKTSGKQPPSLLKFDYIAEKK